MADRNEVYLEGALDVYGEKAPVEVRYTQGGLAVASFQLLTSETFNGKEVKTWHDITAWRELGESCASFLKGDRLSIKGKLSKRSWTNKEGKKQYKVEVVASEIKKVGEAESDVPW